MDLKDFKNKVLITGTLITSTIYLIWRIFFTIPFEYGVVSTIAGISLLIVEIFGTIEATIHFRNMYNMEYPKRPKVCENLFPDVDVFIATYNEPVDLLYKTVNGCVNMDYPDKSKVHIYICDDSNRKEMRELADKFQVNYVTRTERKHAKAGNLNNAMKHSNSPLIVTFDADMIPMHDFLTTCVPYFLDDNNKEKIGFVQAPQSFYNPDLFQYNLFSEGRIPNEQDYFYRDIQVARNKSNSVIYGGSNTVISREALNEIGGFYTDVITEDFATGMLIQSKGYRCYAIDEIHASGLSPSDLKSLIKQRERWARGCIQTGRKLNIIFRKGLNLEQKLSYVSAISYWYSGIKRLIYIISPILYAVFGIMVVKCTLLEVLVFWLPMYLFNNAALTLLSNNIRNIKWSNVYETILFPSLLPAVILETLCISQKKFAVTRKDGPVDDRKYQIKKAIPHIILAILSAWGIMNCVRMIFKSGSLFYVVLLFWLIINFYNVIMSIFFMLGRKLYRKSERFPAKVDCEITYNNNNKIKCKTIDVSEGGVAVNLNFPSYISYDKEISISLQTDRYSCNFKGQIVQVTEIHSGWKYAFKVTNIDEMNLRQLLNITYDREPGLPKTIEKHNSVFDDIRINILKRKNKDTLFTRKLPRIRLERNLVAEECGDIILKNFNYEYAVIKTNNQHKSFDNISIPISKNITLNCVLENIQQRVVKKHINKNSRNEDFRNEDFRNKKSTNENLENKNGNLENLYKIENYKEIIESKEFEKILLKWIEEYKNEQMIKKQEEIRLRKSMYGDDELNEMAYL